MTNTRKKPSAAEVQRALKDLELLFAPIEREPAKKGKSLTVADRGQLKAPRAEELTGITHQHAQETG